MGSYINRRDFQAVIKQVQQGVFVLTPKIQVPVKAIVVNIGLLLGERLFIAKNECRSINIPNELDSILGNETHDVFLENIDILFTPEYGLDVIKLLLQLGRNQRFFLQWPGEITGEKVTYSEPGRFDFKDYNIKNYVDTYVVLR